MTTKRRMFLISIFFIQLLANCNSIENNFIFNGFNASSLKLDGITSVSSNGLLVLTNATQHTNGHAFFPTPLHFNNKSKSFSTTFVFAMVSKVPYTSGHGLVFLLSPTTNFSTALSSQFFGVLNPNDNGNATNHIFGIEFDTIQDAEFDDIDANHVGIDINSLNSSESHSAGYYDNATGFQNLTLWSGQPMQAWIDYDDDHKQISVTLSNMGAQKPKKPLMFSTVDLVSVILDTMYVGFASATGSFSTSHYILGWSLSTNGVTKPLDYSKLPSLPRIKSKQDSHIRAIALPIALCLFIILLVAAIILIKRYRMKYAEVCEDWEIKYGPSRFPYKQLYDSTNGFEEKGLLGTGGFGRVYKGILPTSKVEVAIKKVSHESRQGMKEFVAEIVSIGTLGHRNLVKLLGYCRRKGELLLVYEYMPNGSLDKYLHDKTKQTLNWTQRFHIIKGVASSLLYLHEDWEQVVIHRDVKASNVLLDSEMNGRLGDFGLARLYDHGIDPQTTHVVGTMGYLAPELAKTGKATTKTDVFAFGAFSLEVVCGRRPIDSVARTEEVVLMDWVLENWKRGALTETMDLRLSVLEGYDSEEVELVMKVGLLCLNPMHVDRPTMREVVQLLEGERDLFDLPESYLSICSLSMVENAGFDDYVNSLSSSTMDGVSVGISQGR